MTDLKVARDAGSGEQSDEAEADENNEACNGLTSCRKWKVKDVQHWAKGKGLSDAVIGCLVIEQIDGCDLLELNEDDIRDFRYRLHYNLRVSDMKKLWVAVRTLQQYHASLNSSSMYGASLHGSRSQLQPEISPLHRMVAGGHVGQSPGVVHCTCTFSKNNGGYYGDACTPQMHSGSTEGDNLSPPMSVDGRATNIPPELFKTAISVGYSFLVTWITSFVMVIVHERVPDMKRYPPLPDIFLDNVPHIPWAFHMCEITGTLLFMIWCCVCIFHRYRLVLLRRFFALAGTVFLLRCVTMLITSLSVPGTHLQCNQNDYAIDDTDLTITEALELRISRAYTIWSGLGMSIQGVRTCGDYMFSGHTVALTLLNFFITEYTPRNLYFLHTLTWLLNMFGIFFILAAHEHYSIDVFVAFYITSRLFLYYHTLANNQALMSHDSNRTRIWFPMFSYFESSIDGIVPNEYDTVSTLLENLFRFVLNIKDSCMLTARRFWIDAPQHLTVPAKNLPFLSSSKSPSATKLLQSAVTSTNPSTCNTPTTKQLPFDNNSRIEGTNKAENFSTSTSNRGNDKKYI